MPIAIAGIVAILVIAVLLSERKRAISPRIVLLALAVQASIAAFVLYVPVGQTVLDEIRKAVLAIIDYANAGVAFMFGNLATDPERSFGFIFAVQILPIIIFVSSLMAVLYHLRIMQLVVLILGGFLERVIGISRIEALCSAANIFVGPVESPLAVRPYLGKLTRAQLFQVMTAGLASVSGAILVGYASLGIDLGYLIAAAFMSAPGGIVMAKLLIPDAPEDRASRAERVTLSDADLVRSVNVIEAATDGATQGVILAANIGAALIAFVALVAMVNGFFSFVGGFFGMPELSLNLLLGYAFAPIVLALGVPWSDALIAGDLLGQKTVLNEFIAFASFVELKDSLSSHSQAVVTFALCGFANLNALAIVISGLGAMLPERKSEISRLGLKAVLAGTLSNLMSAALASLFLSLGSM